MKIAIIGAGISGLSAGRMLSRNHEVEIFEKSPGIGGMIRCERINGALFHKIGGHVFNSKNQKVLDWFWSFFDKENEFTRVKRNARVLFDNQLLGYPIENYLYMLDQPVITKIVNEIISLQSQEKRDPFSFPDFESFLKTNFGNTLYEIYFKPYNQKIWQVDLSTVSMSWLEGKLPMPDYREIILSNILREEESTMVHSTFYYPVNGGSQFLVDRLSEGLTIQTDQDITQISLDTNGFQIGGKHGIERIIFTGDVRRLPGYCDKILSENGIDLKTLKALRSNGTSNLLCYTDDTDISWLYIPQDFTLAHRIIYTGNFSVSNNPPGKRKTCVVEFSGKVDPEIMKKEIAKLPGNLEAIDFNYAKDSYIVHDHHSKEMMIKVKAILERNNIYLLGRFAEWEYYNMDKCIESCFRVEQLLSDSKN